MPAPHTSRQVETKVPVWPWEGQAPNLLGPRGSVDGEVHTHASLMLTCVWPEIKGMSPHLCPLFSVRPPEVPAHHQHSSIQVFIERKGQEPLHVP